MLAVHARTHDGDVLDLRQLGFDPQQHILVMYPPWEHYTCDPSLWADYDAVLLRRDDCASIAWRSSNRNSRLPFVPRGLIPVIVDKTALGFNTDEVKAVSNEQFARL